MMHVSKRRDIYVRHDVAVPNQRVAFSEKSARVIHSAGGAEQIAFFRNADVAELRFRIAHERRQLGRVMMRIDDDAIDLRGSQSQRELREHRTITDRHQRLRAPIGERQQARADARRENHRGRRRHRKPRKNKPIMNPVTPCLKFGHPRNFWNVPIVGANREP